MRIVQLLFLVFIFCLNAAAQELMLSADRDSILIGDQIELTVKSTFEKGQDIILPDLDSLGIFELVSKISFDTTESGFTQKLAITCFDSGYYHFGPLPALVVPELGKIDTIFSNELFFYVNTVPVDTSAAIKDIKPVFTPEYPWRKVMPKILAGVGIFLLLIGLIFYLIWRSSRPEKAVIKPKSLLDHFNEARSGLQKLEQKKLWQKGEVKEYYLALSEILRSYLEGRFKFNAMESTTDEILEEFNGDKHLKAKLKEVLQQSDLAKFAKFKPADEDNNRLMKTAKDFVLHTKPSPEVKKEGSDV